VKYWTDPYTLFWVEAIMMNFAELKRWQVRSWTVSQAPCPCLLCSCAPVLHKYRTRSLLLCCCCSRCSR